jgi:methylphosphotriester-DNA--protein-cysteine methyltransferase
MDRRELEQWLAREVAVRTRELEERSAAIEEVALDALAAARRLERVDAALEQTGGRAGRAA